MFILDRGIKIQCLTLVVLALLGFSSAQATDAGITYHGRLLSSSGAPIAGSVNFKIQVVSPGSEQCVLWEETQTQTLDSGTFVLNINSPTASTRTDGESHTFAETFSNFKTFTVPGKCASGATYTPGAADARIIKVSFDDGTGWDNAPNQTITFAPTAIDAQQVAGFPITSLLRVADGSTMGSLSPLSHAQYTELTSLIAGSSTQYAPASSNGGTLIVSSAGAVSSPSTGSIWLDTTDGQLKYDSGAGTRVLTSSSNGAAVTSVTAGTGLSGGTITSTGTIGIAAGGVTATELADSSVTSAKIVDGTITGADLATNIVVSTTGTVSAASVGTRALGLSNAQATPNSVSLYAPTAAFTNYALIFPSATPAANQVLQVSNATTGQLVWTNLSAGSVTSVAAATTSGNPISVDNTTASTPKIDIAKADGTHNGYLSSTDFASFAAKLSATLTSGTILVGNSTNVATAVTPSGDVTMTNAGAFTVTQLQGTPIASTTPLADQVLIYDGTASKWSPKNFSIGSLRTVTGSTQFAQASCSSAQTLTWSSLTDTFTCANISIAASAVTGLGTAAALNVGVGSNSVVQLDGSSRLPAVDASQLTGLNASAIASGTINAARLPTSASTWATNGSDISNTNSGNVGIGTSTPGSALDVNGALSLRAIAAPAVSPLGQGRIYFDSTSNNFKVSQNNGPYLTLATSGGSGGGQTSTSSLTFNSNSDNSGADGGFNFQEAGSSVLTISNTGIVSVPATTASTSVSSGALTVAGGLGVSGTLNAGVIAAANGTAAAPGLTFTSDLATGAYLSQASTYAISTGGGERLRIDPSGRVGIGTTSPTARLTIAAGSASAGTAPLKLAAGINLTTPEVGAVEFDGTNLYYTNSVGRQTLSTATGTGAQSFAGDVTMNGAGTGLTVTNNAAVGGNVAIGGSQTIAGDQTVTGLSTLTGGLNSAGQIAITNPTASTSTATGALTVAGGVGVGGTMNIGGAVNAPLVTSTTVLVNESVGVGTTAPTALLTLGAGTSGARGAPLKLTAGTNLTTPEAGAVEYDGTNLYYTDGTATRRTIASSTASNIVGALSSLTAATATNTIDSLNFAQTWNWSTASTQTPMTMNANALTTGSVLSIASSNATLNSTNGLLNVGNTGASTTGTVARIQSNSAAGSGLTVLANGKVGIGTTAPAQTLDVAGGVNASMGVMTPKLYPSADSTSAVQITKADGSTSVLTVDTANSRIGIGTTSPSTKLDITSSGTASYMQLTNTANSAAASGGVQWANNFGGLYPVASAKIDSGIGATGQYPFLAFYTANTTLTGGALAERMRVDQNGNVGIGNTAPAYKLDIAGSLNATSINLNGSAIAADLWSTSSGNVYRSSGSVGIGTTSPATALDVATGNISTHFGKLIGTQDNSNPVWQMSRSDGTQISTINYDGWGGWLYSGKVGIGTTGSLSSSTAALYVNGNVGIGTTTPASKLDVGGGLSVGAYAGATAAPTNGMIVSGNVGIGTTSPNAALQIYGSSASVKYLKVGNVANPTSTAGAGGIVVDVNGGGGVYMGDSTAGNYAKYEMYSGILGIGTLSTNPMALSTNNVERVRIDTSGNVGIGTTTPTAKLNIAAGTATSAPLQLTSGANLTTPLSGAIEYDGTSLYYTDATATRRTVASTSAVSGSYLPLAGGTMTGAIIHSNGTVAAPSLSFANDPTTGFFSPSAGVVGIGTTATERMRILANGNVGIGTTSPAYLFTAGVTAPVSIDSTGVIRGASGAFSVDASGSIGANLLKSYNGSSYGLFQLGSSGSGVSLSRNVADGYPAFVINQSNASSTGDILDLQAGGVTRFAVQQGGNVGIGTTAPSQPLTVAGNAYVMGGNLLIGNGYSLTDATSNNQRLYVHSVDGIKFATGSGSSTERMRIDTSGNVGIGTTTPGAGYKLDVAGSINATGININGSPLAADVWSSSGGNVYRSSGSVGIGTTAPAHTFEVSGGSGFDVSRGGGANYFFFEPNGTNDWQIGAYATAVGYKQLFIDASNILLNARGSGGNVGIGTTAPAVALQVVGAGLFGNTGSTANGGNLLQVYTGNTASADSGLDIIRGTYPSVSNDFAFHLKSDGTGTYRGSIGLGNATATEAMSFLSNGNVGIGTTSPLSNFDVVGSTSVTSMTGTTLMPMVIRAPTVNTNYAGLDFMNAARSAINPLARIGVITNGSGSLLQFGTTNNWATGGITNTAMTIDPSGNVGIGTTAPAYKLDVAGAINATSINLGGSPLAADLWSSLSGNVYRSSGNVGIGTTAPTQLLHISGTNGTPSSLGMQIDNTSSGSARLTLGQPNYDAYPAYIDNSAVGTTLTINAGRNNYNGIALQTNVSGAAQTRLQITNAGNVGIGTTAPQATLDVAGNFRITSGGASTLQFYDSTAAAYGPQVIAQVIGQQQVNHGSGQLQFYTATNNSLTQQMVIDRNGNVGIGTTAPGAPLHVAPTNTATSGTIYGMEITPTYNQASGTAANTDLLINRTNTAVGSGAQLLIDAQVGGVSKFKVDTAGNITTTGTTSASGAATTSGNFSQTGSATFSTGSGAVSLNGPTTIAAGQNLSMASGAGTFNQVYTGTTTTARTLNADSVTTASADSVTANGLTSGSILNLSSTSTAAAAGNTGLNVTLSGANATSGITRTGISSAVSATGTNATNVGGSFSASGGTNNYGLLVPAGNVGIGTTAPNQPLHVYQNSNSDLVTLTENGYSGKASYIQTKANSTFSAMEITGTSADWKFGLFGSTTFSIFDGLNLTYPIQVEKASPTGSVYIKANGNVGIGTTAPSVALDVMGANGTDGFRVRNPAGSAYLYAYSSNGGYASIGGWNSGTASAIPLTLNAAGGNVGIGSTAPVAKLDVALGTNQEAIIVVPSGNTAPSDFVAGGAMLALSRASNGQMIQGIYTYDTAASAKNNMALSARHDMVFQTGNGYSAAPERMRIDQNGNVGIGTTVPLGLLDVKGGSGDFYVESGGNALDLSASGTYYIKAPNANEGLTFQTGGSNSRLVIDNLGNVGIGTTAPAQKLDVYGSIAINGTSICTSSGCTSSSDRSLKENIQPLQNSLDKILQLQGVEYDYKDKQRFTEKHQVGVIAQDVEKVYPEVVLKDSKTGLRSVAYDHLVGPLIEAFKTLYNRVVDVESHQLAQARAIASITAADRVKDLEIAKLKQENTAIKSYLCSKDPKAPICH